MCGECTDGVALFGRECDYLSPADAVVALAVVGYGGGGGREVAHGEGDGGVAERRWIGGRNDVELPYF